MLVINGCKIIVVVWSKDSVINRGTVLKIQEDY